MLAGTATEPMLEGGHGLGRWLDRARDGEYTNTVLTWLGGGSGWLAILPFLALGGLALATGLRGAPRLSKHAVVAAAVSLAAWALLALTTPRVLAESFASGDRLPLLTVALLLAAAALIVVGVERGHYLVAIALLPMLVVRLVLDRSGWALVVAVVGLGCAVAPYAWEAIRMRRSASHGRTRYSGRTAVR
jgi:hypothetical protein